MIDMPDSESQEERNAARLEAQREYEQLSGRKPKKGYKDSQLSEKIEYYKDENARLTEEYERMRGEPPERTDHRYLSRAISRIHMDEEMRQLPTDTLLERLEESKALAEKFRIIREQHNSEVREHIDSRNAFNAKVKERIAIVETNRKIRSNHNSLVTKAKELRIEIDVKLKEARKSFRSSHDQGDNPDHKTVRELEKQQKQAHERVQAEVSKAQDAHHRIEDQSQAIDELRDKATESHSRLVETKKLADAAHNSCMENVEIINSIYRIGEERGDPRLLPKNKAEAEKQANLHKKKAKNEESLKKLRADYQLGDLRDKVVAKALEVLIPSLNEELAEHESEFINKINHLFLRVRPHSKPHKVVAVIEIFNHTHPLLFVGQGGSSIKEISSVINEETGLGKDALRFAYISPRRREGVYQWAELLEGFDLHDLRSVATQLGVDESGQREHLTDRIVSNLPSPICEWCANAEFKSRHLDGDPWRAG